MKIAIDLRMYNSKSGIARYNQEFLHWLKKLDKENQYILIFKEDPEIDLPENFKIEICDCHWYSFKEQFVLPYLLYKLKPDLVHFPHFNVPILYNSPFIVTIHDLIMTKFPSRRASTLNSFAFKLKYWFYQQVIRHAVINAETVIAVSHFTAKDIINYFSLCSKEAQRIKVVYEGVSHHHSHQDKPFDMPKNFFLYVGNAYPHKNLEFLIDSFREFYKKHPEYHLVLAGNKDYFYKRLIKNNDCPNIVFTGFVSDSKLAAYYQNAKAYIFPSKYEGFGLPPLEAMSHDLPVLSSNSSCLPEVLGHSALFFYPSDKDTLVSSMEEIISNHELRSRLVKAGQEQVKKYSWEKMTKNILDIYKNLV